MSRLLSFKHSITMGGLIGAITSIAHIPGANARTKPEPIALDDLSTSSPEALPLDVLRLVAHDRASRGAPVSCPDLRRCDDLDLRGRSIDLNGDESKEWFVTDMGFTGTGAELDYIFQKGPDGRWEMIGRIDGLHLRTVGPKKTGEFLDIHGNVAGVCAEGRGKAVWNGRAYVKHVGRVKHRPC